MTNAKKCDICGELFMPDDTGFVFGEYKAIPELEFYIKLGESGNSCRRLSIDICPRHCDLLTTLLNNISRE